MNPWFHKTSQEHQIMFMIEVKLNYPLYQQFLYLIRDSTGRITGYFKDVWKQCIEWKVIKYLLITFGGFVRTTQSCTIVAFWTHLKKLLEGTHFVAKGQIILRTENFLNSGRLGTFRIMSIKRNDWKGNLSHFVFVSAC